MSKNLYFEDEIIQEKFSMAMIKRMVQYASAYKKEYKRVISLLIATSLFSLVPVGLNKLIIDYVLPKNGVLREDYVPIATILLSMWITLSLGSVISNYFTSAASTRLGNSVICDLRKDMFEKLMKLGFDYYDSRPTGKILVRITNYTDEIADFFVNDMTRITVNVFMMIMSFICIVVIEKRLALVVILVCVPLIAGVWCLSKALYKRVCVERNKHSNRTAFVAEDISGLEVIKAFNRETLNEEIHENLSEQVVKAFMATTRFREIFYPMTHGVIRVICSIILYAVALLIIDNQIGKVLTLGSVVAVTTYMQMFSENVYTICQRLQKITNLTSNIERVFDVLDTDINIVDRKDAKDLGEIEGNVSFDHVTFSYNSTKNVLSDINIDIKSGEMIALVGPTGGGKTTFVSLINRFYDVTEGAVKIDGIDIRDVKQKSLREKVGVMMQDTFLFSGEIIENIRFAKPDATDEECMEAAKKVFAHNFIEKMPEGYHTVISSQSTQLSGGEKQLLSFARLMLADPKVIILDEATSNIDSETEGMIQEMFKEVLKGRTSFVIAHRLSTIKNADRILYIDNEQIVEQGTHGELLQKKGKYYKLVMQKSE
ncbi:ABC transporter ATP-binding protein [Anaerosporobacter sp.]|uniref:ABC transporter ATP-binding protein n=1 Tax=Anaerosporobacter sp. TaxID=1872529 RepID=UPI00286EB9DC|nr:ABC transporter ATP-binding protein [Anaerosporobacter sp.]